MASNKRSRDASKATGQLRIIGGQWRGRKLAFRNSPGLRPTTDRVRETLFNWLAPDIAGARCLDLFAGSGALGLEALSRGAQHCDFNDTNRGALDDIAGHLQRLSAGDRGQCTFGGADAFIAAARQPYDLIFVDPPFSSGLAEETLVLLARSACVKDGSFIYLETGQDDLLPQLPEGWSLYRDKRAGGVSYRLLLVTTMA